MKKQVLYTIALSALLSSSVLSSIFVNADENGDATTATAKVTFTGDNSDSNDPVNPDPDDPDNHGTGDKGPLSIDYVTNITFGTQEISGSTQVYNAQNATPNVQVTDKRGVEGGWTLTATTSTFVAEDQSELKGAILSLKNGVAQPAQGNTSAQPTVNQDVTFDNSEAKVVMSADSLAGEGTWADVFAGEADNNENVQLTVPAGSAQAKEYTATITWTLAAGPNA